MQDAVLKANMKKFQARQWEGVLSPQNIHIIVVSQETSVLEIKYILFRCHAGALLCVCVCIYFKGVLRLLDMVKYI